MEIILICIIIILLIVIIYQNKTRKQLHSDMEYSTNKLENIILSSSNESVKVFTDNVYLQQFLNAINELLNINSLVSADAVKSEMTRKKMLSNISHDLKTPLTIVVGYIETILTNENMSNEKRKELLLKVDLKAKELISLINKFFDLTKLESEDTEFELSSINVNEVCRTIILGFYDTLASTDINVEIEISDEDLFIEGNDEILKRVLNNLISNAIRYGSEGNVLGLSLYSDNEYVYVEVWDRGKGIEAKFQTEVFERLYTLEDSRNKSYQGSGLGLTITKRLIEKMKGEITIISKAYSKTSFIVKLKKV